MPKPENPWVKDTNWCMEYCKIPWPSNETAYVASISNILQKKSEVSGEKKQLGALVSVVVQHIKVNWKFWLLPCCWWTAWSETKSEALLLLVCPEKWGQPNGGCKSQFYQGEGLKCLLDQAAFTGRWREKTAH